MMEDYYGNQESKIWLIGDSPPEAHKEKLRFPLDPRHPAVHNIWTPVLGKINEHLFSQGLRLNEASLYIRNALNDGNIGSDAAADLLKEKIFGANPTILITFGETAYNITYKAVYGVSETLKRPTSRSLGEIFCANIEEFNVNKTNILPLLHVSVCRRHFLEAQAYFLSKTLDEYMKYECQDDYFAYVGEKIVAILNDEYFYKAHNTLLRYPI